ncbi:MAG: TonB-dependent receptor [Cytophagales bacterium]|nr:TonB-dependent receptor [Cytophagales bacterium]
MEYRYNGAYLRFGYNFRGKYVLNLTGRRDSSSRFGPNNQFGNFGAIGIAWIFSEEAFIDSVPEFLSFGKLRGSYGTTGNDLIGEYQFLAPMGPLRGLTTIKLV